MTIGHHPAPRQTVREAPAPAVAPRTPTDLLLAQLAGIDRCAVRVHPDFTVRRSREARMDRECRISIQDRERAAMLAWVEREPWWSVLAAPPRARAVLAHRQPRFRDAVGTGLEALGIRVVAAVEDGADAAGIILAEQPEIALLDSGLSTLRGLDVVARVHAGAPGTFVGIQVTEADEIGEVLSAGAGSAFTPRVPPADVVVELVRCLTEQELRAVS